MVHACGVDAPPQTEAAFRLLTEIGPRRAGTDAERRAAAGLVALLGDAGRPKLEATYVHPQSATVHMLHCLVAIAGSLVSELSPAAGFALVLAAATSLYLDLTGRLYLVRRLFFRRGSQNVVCPALPAEGDRPLVLLHARYDSGLTGAVLAPGPLAVWERVQRLWPAPLSPLAVVFWAMALLVPALGVRLAGVEEAWVPLLQLPQTLVLIVAAFALGEIALSAPAPGANGAAGAAAAVGAFAALGEDPPAHLDLHLLLTGGGESTRQGLRELLRTHRRELRDRPAWLIDLDAPGRGAPRWVLREVPVLTQNLDPGLAGMLDALAEDGPARPLSPGPAGGAAMAAGRGIAATALTTREGQEFFPPAHNTPADTAESVEFESVAAVVELAVGVVRLLDREAARLTAGDEP